MKDLERAWQLLSWNGQAHWFAKPAVSGGRLYSFADLERTAAWAERAQQDLYLHLNPTVPCGIKGSRHHITHWRYVLVDLDPVDPHPVTSRVRDFRALMGPGHNLYTGRGYHWWLPLDPLKLTGEDQGRRIERAVGAFLRHVQAQCDLWRWRVDPVTSDLARIVRCPGTRNRKTGELCTFLSFANGMSAPERFLAFEPPFAPEARKILNPDQLLAHLSVQARQFVLHGLDQGGRHTGAWHTAKRLHELGVERELAEELLLRGADRCSPPLEHSAIHRRMRQVYGH